MKKQLFLTVCILCLISSFVQAQPTESARTNIIDGKSQLMFKPIKLNKEMTEIFEVTGTGGATFTSSNTADGSVKSFDHALRITLTLTTNSKAGSFQLVFYPESEDMPYAAINNNGNLSIYYPINLYESIKQKLDQYLNARKKVQLKIVQRTDGFREGSLIFN